MKIITHIEFVNRNMKTGLILFLMIIIGYNNTAYSQPCDPRIIPLENSRIRYQKRGNRCEGFYRSDASVTKIDIMSLVKGGFLFKSDKNEIVEIFSPVVKDKPVYVRAVGIPIKTYYRMDAKISQGQKLRWPIGDLIYPQKLSSKKIGVFGWIGKEAKKIYVPVRAAAKMDSSANDGKIRLCVRAPVNVEQVKWRSSHVTNGICSSPGKWNDPDIRKRSFYRTGQPIRIILPSDETGELCVEISAKKQNSARWLNRSIRVMVRSK